MLLESVVWRSFQVPLCNVFGLHYEGVEIAGRQLPPTRGIQQYLAAPIGDEHFWEGIFHLLIREGS